MGGLDEAFWGDRLEVGTELIQQQLTDDEFMERWSTALGPRRRAILVDQLGLDPGNGKKQARSEILDRRDELLPFLLVDAAASGKRTYAILEVARAKLAPADVERCRKKEGEENFDRNALMWLLYLDDPEHLELVFRLDQCQKRGFARMVLPRLPRTNGVDASKFFRKANLQKILTGYEEENKTRRQSFCAGVLHDGGNYQVFIKRDTKENFVSHGAKNTWGCDREWIILDVEPDLRRISICSISPDVPLLLANRIASSFFGKDVEYQNDTIETGADQISAFLGSLAMQQGTLPLVELTAKNCGLDGSPQLRLNDQHNESIGPALQQFAAAFGNPLDHLGDIESIKVHAFKKRVKMIFEPVEGDEESFVVRYADQPLNGGQRREFEQMMEQEYGITVLSTEKRRAP